MNAKHPVRFSLATQVLVAGLFSLFALIQGLEQAYSLLLGAMIYIVPNLYFTHYAFCYRGAVNADWIRRSFMRGQMGKLSLATMGFALTFRFSESVQVFSLFAGYILMIFTQWWLGNQIASAVAAGAQVESDRGRKIKEARR